MPNQANTKSSDRPINHMVVNDLVGLFLQLPTTWRFSHEGKLQWGSEPPSSNEVVNRRCMLKNCYAIRTFGFWELFLVMRRIWRVDTYRKQQQDHVSPYRHAALSVLLFGGSYELHETAWHLRTPTTFNLLADCLVCTPQSTNLKLTLLAEDHLDTSIRWIQN